MDMTLVGLCAADIWRYPTYSLDWKTYFPIHQYWISALDSKHLGKYFFHKDLGVFFIFFPLNFI